MIVFTVGRNVATFELLYNALMVSKTQLSLGCVICRYNFSISGDVIHDAGVT